MIAIPFLFINVCEMKTTGSAGGYDFMLSTHPLAVPPRGCRFCRFHR